MKCCNCGKNENPYWVIDGTGLPYCADCAWEKVPRPEDYLLRGSIHLIEQDPLAEAIEKANEQ